MQQITDVVGEELKLVERGLLDTLCSQVPLINKVGGYIIESGGKRFRPLLYLLVAKYCKYDGEYNIPLACVFEYIHTATLLHDDVLDQAETRRGNFSANSVWGDRTSMLVGDFLFSKAFSILVKIGNQRAMQVISDATTKVAEGETLQNSRGSDPGLTEEEYTLIINNKTASLIEAACQAGAIMGTCDSERETCFQNYGRNLGIAFQMVDDSLDYASDDHRFGKTLCKDLHERKITLPLIHTLREATSRERDTILKLLQKDCFATEDVIQVTRLITEYRGIPAALGRAREYIDASIASLNSIEPSPVRDALVATANYVVERKR